MHPTPIRTSRDEHDEQWARWMREELGRKRWLLSWHALDDASWLARLSSPDWPETVEMIGLSRCHAIGQAHRALELILASANRLARRDQDTP